MRNFCFAIAGGLAASALAMSAYAQSRGTDQVSSAMPPTPAQNGDALVGPVDNQAHLQESYDLAVMMLKRKMERLAREDGGELSAAHQASLQKELDDVNRRFGAARLARR